MGVAVRVGPIVGLGSTTRVGVDEAVGTGVLVDVRLGVAVTTVVRVAVGAGVLDGTAVGVDVVVGTGVGVATDARPVARPSIVLETGVGVHSMASSSSQLGVGIRLNPANSLGCEQAMQTTRSRIGIPVKRLRFADIAVTTRPLTLLRFRSRLTSAVRMLKTSMSLILHPH